MHDWHILHHGGFHGSDYLAITLAFTPTIFAFFSDNSSVFVAIAAILGGAFTVYRWITVYLDRRKTQRREKELNKIVNRHIYGDDK